jgi:hypothetical protein
MDIGPEYLTPVFKKNNGMKKIVLLFIAAQIFGARGYAKSDNETPVISVRAKGIVKGVVKNADGSPIAKAKVVIENTIHYASYVYAVLIV